MVDATLKDTTTVPVSSHSKTITSNFVENEVGILWLEVVQAFLDDMIAIQVLNEADYVSRQSMLDGLNLVPVHCWVNSRSATSAYLFGHRDVLDHLLQGTSAVLVERNLDHVRGGIVDEFGALIVVAVFEKFLAQIIAERICWCQLKKTSSIGIFADQSSTRQYDPWFP
jgi:hypothetical protein